MTERGVFAIDRGLFDHPVFADEPFTEREAWAWMIGEAAWKGRTKRVGSVVVRVERGQLAASVRFLAERWRWSKSRVDRFLKRLKTGAMIGTDAGTGILVITICNYDKYQRVSMPVGTDSGTPNGTAAGQQRDSSGTNENTGNTGESIKGEAPRERETPPFSKTEFDRIERVCRHALGELAPCDLVVGPVVHLIAEKGYDLERQVVPAMIDAARSKPVRTWRLLATMAAERLAAPPIPTTPTRINGGYGEPTRKRSIADLARADIERCDDERPQLLRVASG